LPLPVAVAVAGCCCRCRLLSPLLLLLLFLLLSVLLFVIPQGICGCSCLFLRQIQDECIPDLLFEVVILTLERSEGEGSPYFVFVLAHMRQGTPTLILL
jgi:hypothetical protein